MGKIPIPTNQAELMELLSDDNKRAEIFADAETTKEFLAAYSKVTDKSGEVAAQISEQVQNGIVEFMKDNGLTDNKVGPEVTVQYAHELMQKRGSGAVMNAARNPNAPGSSVDALEFSGVADYLQTIHPMNLSSGRKNPDKLAKLKEVTNAYSSQQADLGGFLVPEDFRSEIMMTALESGVVRPRATVITMGSQTTSVPFVDQTTHSGSVFGGMIFYWTAESGSFTETEAKFGRVKLEANKLTGYAVVPNELFNDAPALSSWFNQAAPQGLAFYEDQAFLDGDGANEPLGVFNSGAVVEVAKETSQAADTVLFENIVNMYARMLPTSLNRAVWLVNQTVLPQLLTMSIAVGTGGAPVVTMNAASSPSLAMLGRPIVVTEKCAALGDVNDIVFADLSYYLLGDRQTMSINSSEHVKFASDQTAIRLIERVDGRPWIQSAITPLNGDTVSPFVSLAERA